MAASTFSEQLGTTQTIRRTGTASIHGAEPISRKLSRQTFTSVNTGRLRLSWWIYNNDSTLFDLAYFGIRSESGAAFLSFEIKGNGIVTIGSAGSKSNFKLDLAVIGSKKRQEMAIDYDFDTSHAVFAFDGAIVNEFSIGLSDLAELNFRTDDPELYIDDVKLEHTAIQTTSALTDI